MNPRAAVKSFRGAAQRLQGGTSLVFFPEGRTSLDGAIQPFKRGGFLLTVQSKAIVVPVTIRGSRRVLVPRTYHVHGGVVEVILGNAILQPDLSPAELSDRVRSEIVATFNNVTTLDWNSHTISR